MRIPVGRQFAKDDALVALHKGKVTTGTRRITGRIYRAPAALRLDRPWRASASATWRQARCECDSGQLRAMFLFCARMIECGRSIRIAQAVRGLHAKGSYRANPELRGSVVLARS